MTPIVAILTCYRTTVAALRADTADVFPLGSVVYVYHPRFTGFGIVTSYECPPDQLAVRLENGNVWHYEIDTIATAKNRKVWPLWIKREMRRRKAKRA